MSTSLSHQSLTQPPDICPELEVLLACGTLALSTAQQQKIRSLAQSDLDWAYLLNAAHKHRMIPLLYQGLHQICPQAIPTQIETYLSRQCQSNTFRNLFLDKKITGDSGLVMIRRPIFQRSPIKAPH